MSSTIYLLYCSAEGCSSEAVMDQAEDGLRMPDAWCFTIEDGWLCPQCSAPADAKGADA